MLLTLRLSVLYGLVPCITSAEWFCVTVMENVYCAVLTESLYKMGRFSVYEVKCINGSVALKNRTLRVRKEISELPNP